MAATGRPTFLRAVWRNLVLLHYEIDPTLLRPLVPRGTELDLWQDRAVVSIVGFQFLRTRVFGLPIPFHQSFDEINLRFYVVRHVNGEARHGVVFVREVVAQPLIAGTAKMSYNEPYIVLPTRHFVDLDGATEGLDGRARYQWRQERWYTLEASTTGAPELLVPGSEAAFFTHRNWGYTTQRDGGTVEYHVEHPVWRVWTSVVPLLDCDIEPMYGSRFVDALSRPPRSALVAEGSDVQVSTAQRII
jgi:uncharacterized protein YqjF (DUF2071 family)